MRNLPQRLRRLTSIGSDVTHAAADEIERLTAERDALRADAARYRWLKESDWYIGPAPEGDLIGVSWNDFNDRTGWVDAIIDAELAKEGQ